MKLLLSLIFIFFIPVFVSAQTPIFQIEGFTGIQHAHHHNCELEDKSYHRGITMPAGLRFHFNLTENWAIIPGINVNNMIGDNLKFPTERILRLDLKFAYGHWDQFDKLDFTVESGVEWVMNQKRIKFPVYVGTQYHMSHLFDWFTRLRLPTIPAGKSYSYNHRIELVIEVGLAINPSLGPAPKFSSTGNPYILE